MTAPEVRILGLRGLDQREIQDLLPGDVTFESPAPPDRPGIAHEPATLIALLMISGPVLKGLAAWILKKRHRKEVAVEVEKKMPDGSYERVSIKVHISDSSTEADVMRAVGEQLGIDKSLLAAAIGQGGTKV